MLKRNAERTPLLRYWTTRYLITLLIGIIIIGAFSTFWIKQTAIKKRLDIMNMFGAEIADRVVSMEGNININSFFLRGLDRREKFLHIKDYVLLIIDTQGKVLFSKARLPIDMMGGNKFPNLLLDRKEGTEKVELSSGENFYLIKHRIVNANEEMLGWVILLNPEKDVVKNPQDFKLLAIMLIGLSLLGWGVIYLLTKKLSQPITDVANAAKQIVEGNYNIQFSNIKDNIKEEETHQLISSFQDMADRLKQLEMLRTELLAGITHELKTPVTSISALTQAVKDDVVTGEEAKEFLEICSKETNRLKKMIEDLLDFNSFAVGAIKIEKERYNINQLIKEITHQWLISHEESNIKLGTKLPDKDFYTKTDPMRIQQIIYNLLNNAKQAIADKGKIDLIVYEEADAIKIDVKDNGDGIPQEEQHLIFERFYRGKNKMERVRGLGLGLTFSKMIAKALGGDLLLKESSDQGTTFTLSLKKD